jgi:hypothetical protein
MTLESAILVASGSDVGNAPPRRRIQRIDGRSRQARRIKALIASYTARLGGHVDPDRVRRCAELVQIAEDMRAAALRGEPVDASLLFKCEGYADRALRMLGLDKPRGRLPPLSEMVAGL